MTDDPREAERQARVQRITSRSRGKVITATGLMRRYALPDSTEEIERGERGPKQQTALFTSAGEGDRS